MVALPDITRKTRDTQSQCLLVKSAVRFAGAVLILSSVGIWLVPVTDGDAAMVLMKLLVAVVFACVGVILIEAGDPRTQDEVQIDIKARELRIYSGGCGRHGRSMGRYDFDDLADVRLDDNMLTVIARSGAVVVQLPMADGPDLSDLRALLGRSLAKAR